MCARKLCVSVSTLVADFFLGSGHFMAHLYYETGGKRTTINCVAPKTAHTEAHFSPGRKMG